MIGKNLSPFRNLGDAELDDEMWRLAGNVTVLPPNLAAVRSMNAAQQTNQCRFARTVGANERNSLVADLKRDVAQDIGRAISEAEVNCAKNDYLPCRDKPLPRGNLAEQRPASRRL